MATALLEPELGYNGRSVGILDAAVTQPRYVWADAMDDVQLSSEFRRVCQAAIRIDRDCDAVIEFEPQLIQLLQLAQRMSRDTAVQCFIEIVRGDLEAPDETIPFCMHALRFPEVREEVKRLVGDPPDPRRMNYVSHVLQAYEDDWGDQYLWPHFGRGSR